MQEPKFPLLLRREGVEEEVKEEMDEELDEEEPLQVAVDQKASCGT